MAGHKTNPAYDSFADAWQLVRDCIAGGRKVKAEGTRYLPKFGKEDPEYADYKQRAVFFNACKRTLQAWLGFLYRNNPQVNTPTTPAIVAFLKDATMTGKAFYDVGQETAREALSVGRRGIVIDWQLVPENRAFLLVYETEDITDWEFGRINGQYVLVRIEFWEFSNEWIPLSAGDTQPPARGTHKTYEQYRTYELIQDGPDIAPYVKVTVERTRTPETTPANKKKSAAPASTEWVVVDQHWPTRGGFALERIPFVPCGPTADALEPNEVPLEPIADVNISHYQTSADYENALHMAGSPTPIFCGFDIKKIHLGVRKGYATDNVNAHAEFLSYNANDASALAAAMDKKEAQMAALGARVLERQGGTGKNQEGYQTVQIRHAGDMSALMMAAIALSVSLSRVLRWVVWWNNRAVTQPEDLDTPQNKESGVYYELNTEFLATMIDSAMLRELTAAYLSGAIGLEEYFTKLQQGGIIGSERTIEEFRQSLDENPNRLPPAPDDETPPKAKSEGEPGGEE